MSPWFTVDLGLIRHNGHTNSSMNTENMAAIARRVEEALLSLLLAKKQTKEAEQRRRFLGL